MSDDVDIRIRLRDGTKAAKEARLAAGGITSIGTAAKGVQTAARGMSTAVNSAVSMAERGARRAWSATRLLRLGIVGAGVAGTKFGFDYNASVEQSTIALGTLLKSQRAARDEISAAQQIAKDSALLNFRDTARAEQQLIGMGVTADRTRALILGTSDALVALGRDPGDFQQVINAFSQIQAKGTVMGDEITQQLGEIFPAMSILRDELGLTESEVRNIGGAGIEADVALDALARGLRSRFGGAAAAAADSWTAQMARLQDNTNQALGAITKPAFDWAEKGVLPAANKAASAITKIFEDDSLAPEEKLRRAREVLKRELGPIGEDIKTAIDQADIPEHLGQAVGAAVPKMVAAAADAGPAAAKAFIDAWLSSGPEVQVITALLVGRKLGAGKGLSKLFDSAKSGGLLGRVASKANPIPVWVVNQAGSVPGAPGPDGKGKPGKTSWIRRAGRWVPAVIPPVAAGAAYAEADEALRGMAPRDKQYRGRVGTTTVPGGVAGSGAIFDWIFGRHPGNVGAAGPAPGTQGLLGGLPINNEISFVMDGRRVAHATTRSTGRAKARK